MNRLQKAVRRAVWGVIFLLGIYILGKGAWMVRESSVQKRFPIVLRLERALEKLAVQTNLPVLSFALKAPDRKRTWSDYVLEETFPLYTFASAEIGALPDMESRVEYELLVHAEQEQQKAETEKKEETEEKPQTERKDEGESAAEKTNRETEVFAEEQLRDFSYLLNRFFVVDPSTTALESQINYDLLMSKDMKLESETDGPKILIYHTHSQEAFADSVPGDPETSIVGVGSRLAQILRDTYGYQVIHHTTVYDMIDGKLDRNMAYTLAAPDIEQILAEHPSIEVVIDLHRDGVDGKRFVTEINGKPTARIMFFNGLSRTARNGAIDYLPNPYIEENLAFSFQLARKAEAYYPGWTRCIYLQSLRYNLHLRPKALLIESGTQLNTVEEEMNAMEPLADILNQVLRGQ